MQEQRNRGGTSLIYFILLGLLILPLIINIIFATIWQADIRLSTYYIIEAIIVGDRKSTRLNSSHVSISYAVFCLKKKNNSVALLIKLLDRHMKHSYSNGKELKQHFNTDKQQF